jgi:simple sugar transport system substrate-binding protein
MPRLTEITAKLLAAGVFGALLLSAAGSAPAVADGAVKVTMIIYTAPGDPFWNPVIHGAQEAAKDRGVSLDIQYADQDPVKQNNLIQTAITHCPSSEFLRQ